MPKKTKPAQTRAQPTSTVYVSFTSEVVPQTTEALLSACANLSNQGVESIYLLLSTPGGNVMHGLTLYNALRAMPFRLVTHNVGNVDSVGNVIFLAGEERYACEHSQFMFHGVGMSLPKNVRMEEKMLRERLGQLQMDQRRIGGVIEDRTNLSTEDVEDLFLEAVTRDPAYARDVGIVHDIRDVEIPRGAPVQQLVFKR